MSGGVGRRPKGAGIVFAAKKIVEIDKLCDRLLSARQETMRQAGRQQQRQEATRREAQIQRANTIVDNSLKVSLALLPLLLALLLLLLLLLLLFSLVLALALALNKCPKALKSFKCAACRLPHAVCHVEKEDAVVAL